MKKLLIISSVLLIILVAGFLVIYKNNIRSSKIDTLDSSSSSSDNEKMRAIKTFISEDLPGFSFDYYYDWVLSTKPFGEEDEFQEYDAGYFSTCSGSHCMGITLSKGATKVQLVIDLVFDMNYGPSCTNTADIKNIGDGWYRIKNEQSIDYESWIREDVTLSLDEGYARGNYNDEWSTVAGMSYRFCRDGIGSFIELTDYSAQMFQPHGGAILLNQFKIKGDTNEEIIKEVDDIVKSIRDGNSLTKTYTSENYSVSFKYPERFILTNSVIGDINAVKLSNDDSLLQINFNQPGIGIEGDVELFDEQILIDGKQAEIDGKLLFKTKVVDYTLDETYYLFGITYPETLNRDYSLLINYSFKNGEVNYKDIEVFDEIVASIKFIE